MLVIKVLEGTLAAGATSISFTDADIPNSIINVSCTVDGLYPSEQTISSTTLTIKYEAQASSVGVAVYLIKASLQVLDSLTSTDENSALSAKQGKVLKDAIDALGIPALSDLTDVSISDPADGQTLIYDNGEWVNSTPASSLSSLSDVSITSATDGQVLTYDNGEWVNSSIAGGSDNYSTTEQEIGTWIDGTTKIYRKVFEMDENINLSANTWGSLGIDKGSMNMIINGRIVVEYLGNYSLHFAQFAWLNDELVCNCFRNFSVSSGSHVILEYTKTS